MEQKKRNKNALRSRRLIIEAYISLLETYSANKITITKIVEVADLNRSTFYAHFTSPADVLAAIEEDMINRFLTLINQAHLERILENPLPLITEISKLVEKNRALYEKLINGNRQSTFLEKLKELFIEKLMSDKETLARIQDKTVFNVKIRFLAGGYAAILRDWFEGNVNVNISIEELSKIVSETITGGIQSCIA